MAIENVQILIVTAVPTEDIVPHALYLVKEPQKATAQIYKGSADGQSAIKFSDHKEVLHIGATKPEEGSDHVIWYNDETLELFIKTPVDGIEGDVWVTAFKQAVLPQFAGNGVAETMSRSDHHHEGQYVANPQW